MSDDPILDEVREARRKLLESCDGDLSKLHKAWEEMYNTWAGPKSTLDEWRQRHPEQPSVLQPSSKP